MLVALYSSANGMEAQVTYLDVTADNLANVNTNAFKRSEVGFEDLFYQTFRQAGAIGAQSQEFPVGIQVGRAVRVSAITPNFEQGPVFPTGRELDVAIEGQGLFRVLQADGSSAYTRDGALQVDAEGTLVTANGLIVQPELTIPDNALAVVIGANGAVSVTLPGVPPTVQAVGNIELTRFINPSGLQKIGDNLYIETSASGAAQTGVPGTEARGTLRQFSLEQSNVEIVSELINLIAAQRAFDADSRVFRTADEVIQTSNDLVR